MPLTLLLFWSELEYPVIDHYWASFICFLTLLSCDTIVYLPAITLWVRSDSLCAVSLCWYFPWAKMFDILPFVKPWQLSHRRTFPPPQVSLGSSLSRIDLPEHALVRSDAQTSYNSNFTSFLKPPAFSTNVMLGHNRLTRTVRNPPKGVKAYCIINLDV